MMNQIKTKKRVEDFGEVYTNEKEVNSMLDLLKSEANKIESRFLEPAVGNGNFLVKVLERKLKVVRRRYKKSEGEYKRYVFLAISSIYAIDILEDNVIECRERLLKIVRKEYKKIYKEECPEEFVKCIIYLLKKNIICGDGLTGLKNGSDAESIIFSEWTMFNDYVKRRDFAMCDMIIYEQFNTDKTQFLKPRKEFEIIKFKEVYNLE